MMTVPWFLAALACLAAGFALGWCLDRLSARRFRA